MSQLSDYTTELILVVVVGAIIGAIFLGNILSAVQGESGKQAVISDQKEMKKLILYDAMIAYGCDVGGWLDANGDKYWGDRDALMEYAGPGSGRISFEDLNSSMPRVFKGLPCYGTGSTLPGTGTYAENNQYIPVSKEWRDDQEGKYSRIRFKINESISSPIRLPKCFIHDTASPPNDVGSGISGDQYENRDQDTEVTNSWFMMSEQDQHSVFLNGKGWGPSTSFDCAQIKDNSATKQPQKSNPQDGRTHGGPAMNVEVLDDTTGASLSVGGTTTVQSGPGSVDRFIDDIEITAFEFEAGTTGYVQTNVGCTNQNPTHSIADPPGLSDKEIKSDECDNKLHPFIVITSTG
jgi:hypothetical protein